jgi:hypothetical protein
MTYQIADEPAPSEGRANFVFRPNAPLLADMLCGSWLSFPWFAINALALGSPTAKREVKLCLFAMAGIVALAFGIYGLVHVGVIESRLSLRLALLGLDGFKLGCAYLIARIQLRTFEVYTYYGGAVQKTMAVIMVGRFLRPILFGLSASPIWHAIIS